MQIHSHATLAKSISEFLHTSAGVAHQCTPNYSASTGLGKHLNETEKTSGHRRAQSPSQGIHRMAHCGTNSSKYVRTTKRKET